MPAFLTATDIPAMHLPLSLLLIFGLAKLLAEVFERIGQPGMIGEILAGVILGPSLLNWVKPDAVLSSIAEIGVMFLLFRVGLEVQPTELFRLGGTAVAVAVAGVILPFIGGWLLMVETGARTVEAVFVGAALVATSVGITAKVLAAKGLIEARASRVILAAAVIDDVLGLIVLAIATSFATGEVDAAKLGGTALMAIVMTGLIARYGAGAVKRVAPKVERRLSISEAQFHFAIVTLFALAAASEYIGVAAIVGAFLAGLAFSDAATERVRDLAHGTTELLVPFFLAGIGLQLPASALSNPRILYLCLAITAIAIVTKIVGCGLGAIRLGRKDALRIGIGMMPRGEVGMVVAQIGLSLGAIEKSLYVVVVVMAVATTLIAPPLLNVVFRGLPAKKSEEEFSLV
jgi:Kef-type K+ transport system membrane component KefB